MPEPEQERHAQERKRIERDAGERDQRGEEEEREAEGGEIEQHHAQRTLGERAQHNDACEHPAAEAAKIVERGAVEFVFERDPAHRQHGRAFDTDAAGRHRPLGGAGEADHGAIKAGSFAVKFGQERGDGGEGVGRAGGGAIEGLDEGEGGTAPFAAEAGAKQRRRGVVGRCRFSTARGFRAGARARAGRRSAASDARR